MERIVPTLPTSTTIDPSDHLELFDQSPEAACPCIEPVQILGFTTTTCFITITLLFVCLTLFGTRSSKSEQQQSHQRSEKQ